MFGRQGEEEEGFVGKEERMEGSQEYRVRLRNKH